MLIQIHHDPLSLGPGFKGGSTLGRRPCVEVKAFLPTTTGPYFAPPPTDP